ncbi:MAG: hypothetical protein KC766_13440 [Myxococcales bacterium]|nr:hypothetical protein [Myxococcales bacterium]
MPARRPTLNATSAERRGGVVVSGLRRLAWFGGEALLGASLLYSTPAYAAPQGNVSIISGLCGEGTRDEVWHDTCWYNALHGDVLFGRDRNSDFGIGPYLEVGTAGFDDLRLGGGGSLQIPVHPYVPAVLSLGGYARRFDSEWQPGLAGDLFIGSRSYNFHSAYVMTGGVSLGARYGVGDSKELTLIVAAQLDSSVLWLPAVILYNWIAGAPDD